MRMTIVTPGSASKVCNEEPGGETMRRALGRTVRISTLCMFATGVAASAEPAAYLVCVSNERSGDVTILRDGRSLATIPVGKRPRGIHPSPDGAYLYVALSGSPITGPPQLDAKGNPILKSD